MAELTLYTIGHSTHTLQAFLSLLKAYQITHLVDVRTIPKSRRVPWFNSALLAKSLRKENILYTHSGELGGLRHAHKDSINQGWHNDSFRGFADYMQTPAFAEGMTALNALLEQESHVAVMCAEALPWRCHRSLIADAELARGVAVLHIMSLTSLYPHKMTAFAKVDTSVQPPRVYYPLPD